MKLKHEVVELEKQVADWRRKIDILVMERNRTRQLLKSLTTMAQTSGVATSAALGKSQTVHM